MSSEQLKAFVFTDIVASTRLKQEMPGLGSGEKNSAFVSDILRPHRDRIEATLAASNGMLVNTQGDGCFLVFNNPTRAALWAISVQESHINDPIVTPNGEPVGMKIAIHWGDASTDPNNPKDYIGRSVDYAARLVDYGRAGQVLVSRAVYVILDDAGLSDAGVGFYEHGLRELRGIGEKPIVELLYAGQKAKPLKGDKGLHAPATAEKITAPADDETLIRPSAGSIIGDYSLDVQIGQGGMGTVFQGHHRTMERQCVIKVINERFLQPGHEELVERFYKEIKLIAKLDHPNIVRAYDASAREEAVHYLVMEYIDGIGIENLVGRNRIWRTPDACEVIRQAAVGLQYISERGLVHRDIKPSNLMLASRDTLPPLVKVLDLGLALLVDDADENRITSVRQRAMGTAYYMPPEQWETTNVDIRADVYALGGTLYHMLAGKAPYEGSRYTQREAHRSQALPQLPPGTDCPPALWETIQKMLAKDRKQRFDTPAEVAQALSAFTSGHDLADAVSELKLRSDDDSSDSITDRHYKTASRDPDSGASGSARPQDIAHTEPVAPVRTAETQPDLRRSTKTSQKRLLQILASIGILLLVAGGFAVLGPMLNRVVNPAPVEAPAPKVIDDPEHAAYATGLLLTEPGHNGVWWPEEELWYFPEARRLLLEQLTTTEFLKIKTAAIESASGRQELYRLLRRNVENIKDDDYQKLRKLVMDGERRFARDPSDWEAAWRPVVSLLFKGKQPADEFKDARLLEAEDWHLYAVLLTKDVRRDEEANIAFKHALARYAEKTQTDTISQLLSAVCQADHGAMYLSDPDPRFQASLDFAKAIEIDSESKTGEGTRRFVTWAAIGRAEIVAKSTDQQGLEKSSAFDTAQSISQKYLLPDDPLNTYLTEVNARFLFEKKDDYKSTSDLASKAAEQRLQASGLLEGSKSPGSLFVQTAYFRDVQLSAVAKHFAGDAKSAVQMIEELLKNYLNRRGYFADRFKATDIDAWRKMIPNQYGRLADVKFYGAGDLPSARDDLHEAITYAGPRFKQRRPAQYAFMHFKMSIFCGLGGTSSNSKNNESGYRAAKDKYYNDAIAETEMWAMELNDIREKLLQEDLSRAERTALKNREGTLERHQRLNEQFEKVATAALSPGEETTTRALLNVLKQFDPSDGTDRDDRQLMLFVCEYLLANTAGLKDFEIGDVKNKREKILFADGTEDMPILNDQFMANMRQSAAQAVAATKSEQPADEPDGNDP